MHAQVWTEYGTLPPELKNYSEGLAQALKKGLWFAYPLLQNEYIPKALTDFPQKC